ncbi:MAG: exonuclease domain-containing protein [Acetobacterales bacterium]
MSAPGWPPDPFRVLPPAVALCCGLLAALAAFGWVAAGWTPLLAAALVASTIAPLALLLVLARALTRRGREVGRAADALATMERTGGAWVPPPGMLAGSGETAVLFAAIDGVGRRWRRAIHEPQPQLSRLIGALAEGVVVITGSGLVSLVNHAARGRFPPDRLSIGSSVFDVFMRDALAQALRRSRDERCAVTAPLALVDGDRVEARVAAMDDPFGALIVFEAAGGAGEGVEHNLRLHGLPEPAPPPTLDTPLAELPALVLDTETTGLDPRRDRVVAVGAVPMRGRRSYPAAAIDLLVNPGRPIPDRSVAVHGISDAMVATAPAMTAIATELRRAAAGHVMVGHSIDFDVAVLTASGAEVVDAGKPAMRLCTMRLAVALDPAVDDLDLGSVAAAHGIDVVGRHTALGDALVTADLFTRLLDRLAAEGVTTLGGALDVAERGRRLIEERRTRDA